MSRQDYQQLPNKLKASFQIIFEWPIKIIPATWEQVTF